MTRSKTSALLLASIFLLAKPSLTAIFRPINANALITVINNANLSPADDIIDLQGNTFAYADSCQSDFPLICTTAVNGPNALPIIAANSGKLSIINGRIIRITQLDSEPTPSFRLIEIAEDGDLTLRNVTLEYGEAVTPEVIPFAEGLKFVPPPEASGGAILNYGELDLQNTTIANNYAQDSGGGIFNSGALYIESSNISNNQADAFTAGVVGTYSGGGGIYNEGSISGIDFSTISNNNTLGFGAGINNQFALAHLFSSTISNNYNCSDIAGAICPNGEPTTSGGGIYNDGCAISLQIINSTIANNVAYQGGGLFNNSNGSGCVAPPIKMDDIPEATGITIYNTTISGNTASQGGGGIYNNDNINLPGPGITPAVIDELVSTIIAGNTDTDNNNSPDIFDLGILVAENNNLVGSDSGNGFANAVNDDIVGTFDDPIDPMLGSLNFYGGFTQTFELLPGSPALNNGDNPYALNHDQRGDRRVGCSVIDIGSFELQNCYLESHEEEIALEDSSL